MKKIICLTLFFITSPANATVELNNFSITESNLAFDVVGTASTIGSSFKQQLLFGLVNSNNDWIQSFNVTLSTYTGHGTNARALTSLYNLSGPIWTDSILTTGEIWQLGDDINISFNFVGVFNLANFDVNNFGMSIGLNSSQEAIVPQNLNLVTGINPVPVPTAAWLFGSGLLGLVRLRKKTSKVSALSD